MTKDRTVRENVRLRTLQVPNNDTHRNALPFPGTEKVKQQIYHRSTCNVKSNNTLCSAPTCDITLAVTVQVTTVLQYHSDFRHFEPAVFNLEYLYKQSSRPFNSSSNVGPHLHISSSSSSSFFFFFKVIFN